MDDPQSSHDQPSPDFRPTEADQPGESTPRESSAGKTPQESDLATPAGQPQPTTDEDDLVVAPTNSETYTAIPSDPSIVECPVVKGRYGVALIVAMVILADITVYRSAGFSGLATFLAASSVLICLGMPSRTLRKPSIWVWALLLVAALRLADHGNMLLALSGLWLLFALALTFRAQLPFVFDVLIFAMECLPGGGQFLVSLNNSLRNRITSSIDDTKSRPWLEFLLPVIAASLFGGIFVMANPDVLRFVAGRLTLVWDYLGEFLEDFSPMEVVFWLAIAWTTGGLLRSRITRFSAVDSESDGSWGTDRTSLYAAYRNTLMTLIVLFVVYLTFESRAFIRQTPPEGFTYSSYAHEGAAWLTAALALATLILSVIFRGATMTDSRLPQLRKLAVIWTSLNFALAIAVCNRTLIYVNFNGMTRMRVVAVLGIGSVVGGLVLAVVKIYRRRRFSWLIQRQLWVVLLACYLYAVLPIDTMIHSWNVRQILGGNPAPVVQITAHPVDDECLPVLLPLCNAEDPLLADGIRGLLRIHFEDLTERTDQSREDGWTAWQRHYSRSLTRLQDQRTDWDTLPTRVAAAVALQKLADHAYAEYW